MRRGFFMRWAGSQWAPADLLATGTSARPDTPPAASNDDRQGTTRDEALLWIIDNQRGRRNLADIDRIALASRRHAIVAAKAKENQVASGNSINRTKESGSGKIAKPTIDTRREVAKTADVGERTYDAGRLILKAVEEGKADPQVLDDVEIVTTKVARPMGAAGRCYACPQSCCEGTYDERPSTHRIPRSWARCRCDSP
jgi:hypothetical protein